MELRADVLKIGHHGSRKLTSPDFLTAVKPRVAIISAEEDNPYGHPNPELLDRLVGADKRPPYGPETDVQQIAINCFIDCGDTSDEVLRRAHAPDHKENNQKQ